MASSEHRQRIIFSDIDGTLAFSKLGNAKTEATAHGTLKCSVQHDGQVQPPRQRSCNVKMRKLYPQWLLL